MSKPQLLAVERGLFPVKHPIVSVDMSNPDSIFLEYVGSSLSFCPTMRLILPQCKKGLFVAPEGEREDLARLGQTLKALDREKSVYFFD